MQDCAPPMPQVGQTIGAQVYTRLAIDLFQESTRAVASYELDTFYAARNLVVQSYKKSVKLSQLCDFIHKVVLACSANK